MIDASASRSVTTKTLDEAQELIEVMASNDYQAPSERVNMKKGVIELDTLNAILAQNGTLTQQMTSLTKQTSKMHVNSVANIQPPLA